MIARHARSLFLVLAAAGVPQAAAGAGPDDPLAACQRRFAAEPTAESSAECFFLAVRAGVDKRRAIGAVSRLLRDHRGHPWLLFYLGALRWSSDSEQATDLFGQAREQFARRGDTYGEVRAGYNLARLLDRSGRRDEGARELARAIERAAGSADQRVVALGAILQARELWRNRQDLERARALLGGVESSLFPDGPYGLRRDWLVIAGDVAVELSRRREARELLERALELVRVENDRYAEPVVVYGLLRVRLEELTELPTAGGREEVLTLAREAATGAAAVDNRDTEALARLVLGLFGKGDDARREIDRCLQVAPSPLVRSWCLVARARNSIAADPAGAVAAIEEAIELARQVADPRSLAFAWSERMRVSWRVESADRAIADSLAALEAIEALRDVQTASMSRAGLFSSWSEDYRWLVGRLLEESTGTMTEAPLERAFEVVERMRARALVDYLEAAQAAPKAALGTNRLQIDLAAVLEEIAAAQRRLLDPALPAAVRAEIELGLPRLELTEADLRGRIESADPVFAALRRPRLANLAEIRRGLADDQALLSFQVAPRTEFTGEVGGGGWLLVVTRGEVRVYPTPDRVELRTIVPMFSGLFERRDDGEAVAAAHLAGRLLGDALADLPAAVERLIIVPDDVLYLLPFAALRDGLGGAPLTARFQLSLVPSATLWLRWSREPPPRAAVPALVLADPARPYAGHAGFDGGAAAAESPRSGAFSGFLFLPPLPQARREGRAVVDHLGGGSALRLGEDASEAFLKNADLRRFGILHFATPAVADEEWPARSAVLLAGGSPAEDGLLQMREIVDLDLDGRVVVLSSCRSASGRLLRGEGVMGLARAFFQAGAHAVVASLWPLEDDDAARLFDRFYRHLADGASVAGALAVAQRERVATGAPAAAWAGLVVLGDGDLVPVVGGGRRPGEAAHVLVVALVALAVAAALAAGLVAVRYRRRRSLPP